VNAPVYALACAEGAIYAGGDFVFADGLMPNFIARWGE